MRNNSISPKFPKEISPKFLQNFKTMKVKFRKSFSFTFEFVSADKILRYINETDIKKSSSGEISPAFIKLAKKF